LGQSFIVDVLKRFIEIHIDRHVTASALSHFQYPWGSGSIALERRSAATAGAHLFERVHYQHPQMISPQTMEPRTKISLNVGA
jgi:hypothetical protein